MSKTAIIILVIVGVIVLAVIGYLVFAGKQDTTTATTGTKTDPKTTNLFTLISGISGVLGDSNISLGKKNPETGRAYTQSEIDDWNKGVS